MWVVDDVQSKSGHHDIALNYLDLIIQRLVGTKGKGINETFCFVSSCSSMMSSCMVDNCRVQLTVGTVKSIVISNKVDDAKIRKVRQCCRTCLLYILSSYTFLLLFSA